MLLLLLLLLAAAAIRLAPHQAGRRRRRAVSGLGAIGRDDEGLAWEGPPRLRGLAALPPGLGGRGAALRRGAEQVRLARPRVLRRRVRLVRGEGRGVSD